MPSVENSLLQKREGQQRENQSRSIYESPGEDKLELLLYEILQGYIFCSH